MTRTARTAMRHHVMQPFSARNAGSHDVTVSGRSAIALAEQGFAVSPRLHAVPSTKRNLSGSDPVWLQRYAVTT